MGKSTSAPSAPDPAATIQAQQAANSDAVRESARVNQVNEVTPYGSRTWTGDIGSPNRTVTTSLDPTSQATLDAQRQLAQQLTGLAGGRAGQIPTDRFSLDGVAQLQGASPEDRQKIEDATYARSTRFLDPQYEQGQRRLEDQLYTKGFKPGDEAWSAAMGDFNRAKSSDYDNARNAAVLAGSQEDSRLFGQSQAARQQGISDYTLSRNQPLNELAAFLQGSPAMQSPSFNAPAQYQVAPADVMGANNMAYQGQMNQYNQGQQNQRSMFGGLAGLGGSLGAAAILASDRALKEVFGEVGRIANGLTLYLFRYLTGGPLHVGFMADEVEKVHPEAVIRVGPYKAVNYELAVL